jgi:glycosyl transferase family 2/glycosyl transferase family 25
VVTPALDSKELLRLLYGVSSSAALYRRCREILQDTLVVEPPIPSQTSRREPKFLTIGMATHDDYDGCYFTIQSIRMHHPEILANIEFLVLDNNPTGPSSKALKELEKWIPNYRYVPYRTNQGTAVRDLIFREAASEFVLCVDCHVLFVPGCLARLIDYCRENAGTNDLLQGPLLSDAMEPLGSHFDPEWSHGMYGRWAMDKRALDADAAAFEIPMQGLGVFACRREAWPGFNPRLAGFGGEEGYLHEKVRRAGGKNLCLPFMRWLHRFGRPKGISYAPNWADRVRNYLLTFHELGMDPQPVIDHFEELLGKDFARPLVEAASKEIASPFHSFDAIYCINLDRATDRWEAAQTRFRKLGIDRRIRRFAAVETPANHHIGCALSHRRIIAEARIQRLASVLVFEDDVRFAPDANEVLQRSISELREREWQLLYLGGYGHQKSSQPLPGCNHLAKAGSITCTHAVAYHESVYERVLEAVPDDPVDSAIWANSHLAIDQYYAFKLDAVRLITCPVIATQDSILSAETRSFDD